MYLKKCIVKYNGTYFNAIQFYKKNRSVWIVYNHAVSVHYRY